MVFQEEQADPGTDPGNYEQMQWHALQGSRQKKASKLVHDESEDGMLKFAMRAQAVTREAGRMCAVWLMRASFGKMSKSGLPYVCDLANKNTSPVIRILQYLSSLLEGTARTLRYVWQADGSVTMSVWMRGNPHKAWCLRRTILHVSALTHRIRRQSDNITVP